MTIRQVMRGIIRPEEYAMNDMEKLERDWEHIYTQFKGSTEDGVLCFMHKQTRQFVYLDSKLKRFLTKQEASKYRLDATGLHAIYR